MRMREETYTVVGAKGIREYILAENLSFEEAMLVIEEKGMSFDNVNIAEEHLVLDKPKNFIVVSDANMMLEETKLLLDRPLKFQEQFVFLGNYICDAPGFYDYMTYLVKLKKRRDCVFVKGKNEYNLLEYINQTEKYLGPLSDVLSLIRTIEKELSFPLYSLPSRFPDFYDILNGSLEFYENDTYIFTSGGLDLEIDFWKQSQPEELFLTTETFLLEPNETGKCIVFGDISLSALNQSDIIRPWFNRNRDKIGINGNCRFGGKLLGLFIHDSSPSFMGIRNIDAREERRLASTH